MTVGKGSAAELEWSAVTDVTGRSLLVTLESVTVSESVALPNLTR